MSPSLAELPESQVVADVRGKFSVDKNCGADKARPPGLRELAFGTRWRKGSQKIYALERVGPERNTPAGELRCGDGPLGDPVRAYFLAQIQGGDAFEGWETRAQPGRWQWSVAGRPVGSMQKYTRPRGSAATFRQSLQAFCFSTPVWTVHDLQRRRGFVRIEYPVSASEPFLFYRARDGRRMLICVAQRPTCIAPGLEQKLVKRSRGQLFPFQAYQDDLIIPSENPPTHPADELLLFLLNIVFRGHLCTLDFGID